MSSRPSFKLHEPQLSSHRHTVASAVLLAQRGPGPSSSSSTPSHLSACLPDGPSPRDSDTKQFLLTPVPGVSHKRPRAFHKSISESSLDDSHDKKHNSKKARTNAPDNNANVQIVDIDNVASPDEPLNKADPTADIKAFFTTLPRLSDESKRRVSCNLCAGGLGCVKQDKILISGHTTLRRHLASLHSGRYRKWCEENNFESMLSNDTKQRRQVALNKKPKALQSTVTDHFKPEDPATKTTPYSGDKAFLNAAIEWLIGADLPLEAFNEPSFKRMLDLVSYGNRSIELLSVEQIRGHIIKMFKQRMCSLKDRLNSPAVSGEISLTCDAWQADHTDGYFTVTGHWIEERTNGEWTLEHALLGFSQVAMIHNGTRLGQLLYKVCNRLGVVHKIGHITCDNAKNNTTMLQEFARCFDLKTKSTFDVDRRHIRCLAYIIDSATQAIISSRSKAKYYSGDPEDDIIPEEPGALERDEVGIIRAICVEARSSAQRTQLFKAIQEDRGISPCQLLLDMKVCWSSTYIMLTCAESRRVAIEGFIRKLRRKETSVERLLKLSQLDLNEEVWTHVRLFCNILQYADGAQHAFSTASSPSLHNVLPALEKLYAMWEKALKKPLYKSFIPALTAGLAKLNEYYQRSGGSHAHLIVMVLNPASKMSHFKKHWDADLISEVEDVIQSEFIQRYEDLNKDVVSISNHRHKRGRLNIDDTDSDSDDKSKAVDPHRPWLREWYAYLNSNEVIPEGMGLVHWWGILGQRYPTWRTLARDYLPAMASSVSSESVVSEAGSTITKSRNRLEGDIVEARQCLKSFIQQGILFHEVTSSTEEEARLDMADKEPANLEEDTYDVVQKGKDWSWDQLEEVYVDEDDDDEQSVV